MTRIFPRRTFLKSAAFAAAACRLGSPSAWAQAVPGPEPGERPHQDASVKVLNPRHRIPLSFIIDDSTCLVNLAYFAIPQFAEVFPDRYLQDWRKLPPEIPDSFVRKFGEWCREREIKGKYSIVPYPACVGWVDRFLPGWTHRQLQDSLALVRDFLMPDWDIHPEMISHTWVVDTQTGRPYPQRTEAFMENWGWSAGRSVDELADYMAYALRILKNAGLTCEGVTTPGGFGSRARRALSLGTLQACQDVFGTRVSHYFRDLFTDDRSVAPRVEFASGLTGDSPQCVVSIFGCTGDWFGGWDGLTPGSVDRFITEDLQGGRLPEVLDRGEPAVLVCHWPGIYYNGEELGFRIFQQIVERVHARQRNLIWMKLSEIAQYWAAKELTAIERQGDRVTLRAPFAVPQFTLSVARKPQGTNPPALRQGTQTVPLREVADSLQLQAGSFLPGADSCLVCLNLARGENTLQW